MSVPLNSHSPRLFKKTGTRQFCVMIVTVIMNYSFDIVPLHAVLMLFVITEAQLKMKMSVCSSAANYFPSFLSFLSSDVVWHRILPKKKEGNWWNISISFQYLPWFSSWQHPSVGIRKWNDINMLFSLFGVYNVKRLLNMRFTLFCLVVLTLDIMINWFGQVERQDEMWAASQFRDCILRRPFASRRRDECCPNSKVPSNAA